MKDNMYTFLNDMDIQVDSYEGSAVSPEEVKRWKGAFKQKKNNDMKKRSHMGGYVAVAILALMCTLALGPFRQETYAQIKTITYSVQEMLGIETDLSSYETVIGKVVAKDGVTITVNDVVMDRNEMVVSYTVTTENGCENTDCFVYVQVNGKEIYGGSAGTSWMPDDNNMVYLEKHHMEDVDVEKENYYKLIFYVHEFDSEGNLGTGRKVGTVEFAASGERLMAETTTVSIDESCEFPNGDKLRFTELSYNIMGPKIFCESENGDLNYDVIIEGIDSLGNKMSFYLTHFDSKGESWFIPESEEGEDALFYQEPRELTLQVYAREEPKESGEIQGEYQSIGAPFSVQLK